MSPEDDMPMSSGKPPGEKPDAEPRSDEDHETTLKIKSTFNDALRVLMGKQKPKDARA